MSGSLTHIRFSEDDGFAFIAGAGKSVISYISSFCVSPLRELMEFASSAIIEDVNDMRKRGLASLGFFCCDFRDDDKETPWVGVTSARPAL